MEKLCLCGCGLKSLYSKGRYRNYRRGHNLKLKEHRDRLSLLRKGIKRSQEDTLSIRKGIENRRSYSGINNPNYGNSKLCGEGNPNWKGGIQFEPYSPDWNAELKEYIKERDNWKCQLCGSEEKLFLVVHHIDYNKKNCFTINLITLCSKCNGKVNFNRQGWTLFFMFVMEKYFPMPIIKGGNYEAGKDNTGS